MFWYYRFKPPQEPIFSNPLTEIINTGTSTVVNKCVQVRQRSGIIYTETTNLSLSFIINPNSPKKHFQIYGLYNLDVQ